MRRLVAAAAVGLTVGFAFVAFFTSALHDPRPNRIEVGIVGPPAKVADVGRSLDRALPGGFDVRRYRDETAARDAIHTQDIDGAFLPGPGAPRLLQASAAGASAVNVLRAAFGAAAAAKARSSGSRTSRASRRTTPVESRPSSSWPGRRSEAWSSASRCSSPAGMP